MYSIDVCIDANRCSENNLDKFIRETAYEYNCSNCFMVYETNEKKKKFNINCIFNIEYDTNNFENMIEFLKIMKKTKYVNIECISNNKIIYSSSYYNKEHIHKKQSKALKKNKKTASKKDQEILDLFNKKSCL